MIAQIGRLGKASRQTGWLCSLWFTAGATAGAALLGIAVAVAGWALRWVVHAESWAPGKPAFFMLALLCAGSAAVDLRLIHCRVPTSHKQLCRFWLEAFGPAKAAALWGLSLGVGRHTRMPYALYYVVLAWLAVYGKPVMSAAVMGTYGICCGALIAAEAQGLSSGRLGAGGLLGTDRGNRFHALSGTVLLLCAILAIGCVLRA